MKTPTIDEPVLLEQLDVIKRSIKLSPSYKQAHGYMIMKTRQTVASAVTFFFLDKKSDKLQNFEQVLYRVKSEQLDNINSYLLRTLNLSYLHLLYFYAQYNSSLSNKRLRGSGGKEIVMPHWVHTPLNLPQHKKVFFKLIFESKEFRDNNFQAISSFENFCDSLSKNLPNTGNNTTASDGETHSSSGEPSLANSFIKQIGNTFIIKYNPKWLKETDKSKLPFIAKDYIEDLEDSVKNKTVALHKTNQILTEKAEIEKDLLYKVDKLKSEKQNSLVVNCAVLGINKSLPLVHRTFKQLLQRLDNGLNTYLVGPAGSGKTMAAEQAAQALGLKFGMMSVGPQTSKTDVFGYNSASGDYVTTVFRERFEKGGVFLFDEIDAAHPGVLTSINAALSGSVCAFPDGMVKKHKEFRCVAAGNTFGTGGNVQYVGRNQMDAASIDRFNFVVWDYDEGLELSIVEAFAKNEKEKHIAKVWVGYVQKCREVCEVQKIKHVVSPRASIDGFKLIRAGVEVQEVVQSTIFKSNKQLAKSVEVLKTITEENTTNEKHEPVTEI